MRHLARVVSLPAARQEGANALSQSLSCPDELPIVEIQVPQSVCERSVVVPRASLAFGVCPVHSSSLPLPSCAVFTSPRLPAMPWLR